MPKEMKASMSKRWSFTINNPITEDLSDLDKLKGESRYLIVGDEIGKENGTPHYQCFVIMQSNQRLSAMKKKLPRAHLEMTSKSNEINVAYCSKDNKVIINHGVLPQSKKESGDRERERWDLARQHAMAGNFDQIESNIYVRYKRNLHEIYAESFPDPIDLDQCTGVWICGESGSGKTTYARKNYPKAFNKEHTKWWSGYRNQESVIIEDFGLDDAVLGTQMKQWADKWIFTAEFKGTASREIRPKHIVVTSQYLIEEIWTDAKTQDALKRRFQVIQLPNPQ